ncbi:MAG: DUF3310 domain-containing protein [Sarcina sp.]
MEIYSVADKSVATKADIVTLDKETVVNPIHYNKGIQVWDYIISHDMNFMEGNIIKYVSRYKYKNGVEDLKKAAFYLEKLIDVVEKEQGNEDNN